jgi:hypothetical protein
MSRTSGVLAWTALVLGATACAAQEIPPVAPPTKPGPGASGPEKVPAPAAERPATARASRTPTLFPHDFFPPPLPAVVDPRTGAWVQVYIPPGECAPLVDMRVGKPCLRCGQKLLHPLQGHERAGFFGRHCPGCGPGAGKAVASDGAVLTFGPDQAELPPPIASTAPPTGK